MAIVAPQVPSGHGLGAILPQSTLTSAL